MSPPWMLFQINIVWELGKWLFYWDWLLDFDCIGKMPLFFKRFKSKYRGVKWHDVRDWFLNMWTKKKRKQEKNNWVDTANRWKSSEDKMAGWHHRCNGHELGQTSGDGGGQRGMEYCSP